jgi:hypothetical protein
MDPKVLLICAVIGIGYYIAKPIAKVAKKTAHGVVHVVTLGKK